MAAGEVVLFDDFASGELDRSVWNVRTTGRVVNDEVQAYIDLPDTVYVASDAPGADGNVLVLHARHRPGHVTPEGRSFDFVSGRIDSRDTVHFRYGEASARIKVPMGEGLWPAFWAMGYGPWPDTGEIDIMEYVGENDWISAAVHGPGYSGEGGLVNKLFLTDDEATDWHVYTVRREPDRMVFLVDGRVVYRVTKPMTEFFGSWQFDDDKFLILNLALGGTYPFKTNGVRSPYYGLPASTVDLIETNEAKVLVDWVRITADAPDKG